jgi:hypothetical protein
MKLNTKTFANEDVSGNRVYMTIYYNDEGEHQNATIALKLKEENNPRQLGNFDFKTRTFYCKRNTEKHFHRKSKSFGFNWTILNDTFLNVDNVYIIVDEEEHYKIPIHLIKEYGTFLNFKQQGFELQRFMSFELIKRYSKIPRNPNHKNEDNETDPKDTPQD